MLCLVTHWVWITCGLTFRHFLFQSGQIWGKNLDSLLKHSWRKFTPTNMFYSTCENNSFASPSGLYRYTNKKIRKNYINLLLKETSSFGATSKFILYCILIGVSDPADSFFGKGIQVQFLIMFQVIKAKIKLQRLHRRFEKTKNGCYTCFSSKKRIYYIIMYDTNFTI